MGYSKKEEIARLKRERKEAKAAKKLIIGQMGRDRCAFGQIATFEIGAGA